jgi:hypothetical protein
VEIIRTSRVTRASAVKARGQALNALLGMKIGGPSPLRDDLVNLTKRTWSTAVSGFAPRLTTSSSWPTITTGCY